MKSVLVIMSRIPVPNKTKTRLRGKYTGEEVANLHQYFLQDIFEECLYLDKKIDLLLNYSDEGNFDIIKKFLPPRFKFLPQLGKELGEKMNYICRYLFDKHYDLVLIIGSDSPQIGYGKYQLAFDALKKHPVVIIPSQDGGYCLLGMGHYESEIFSSKMNWGTEKVFSSTLNFLDKKGIPYFLMEKELDVDYPQDVEKLVETAKERKNSFKTLNYINYLNQNGRKNS